MPFEPERFRNFYSHCGEVWTDNWSCMCNDKCPICNKEIEPYKSEDLCLACGGSLIVNDDRCVACGEPVKNADELQQELMFQ